MAFFTVRDVQISGIVSGVPKIILDNLADPYIPKEQGKKIVENTGIRYRRANLKFTTSDLCLAAAEELVLKKNIDLSDIKYLVFVTQTPDYVLPATATILQKKLKLSQDSFCLDISLGCSGYVYGLSVLSSLLEKSQEQNTKGLLLVGDTTSKLTNIKDLSAYPLFGDAGSATLLEKTQERIMNFDMYSDGSGEGAIKVKDGGYRNVYTPNSDIEIKDGNNTRRRRDVYLNGMDVFSFGITKVPKAIKIFYEKTNTNDSLTDFYIFHQANLFMNEKIRKKLKLEKEKVPYSLYDYGNVSSATIPLTITSKLNNQKHKKIIACGFGVGLSWGTCDFLLDEKTYLDTIEI
ncbi:MAG: ketoacyl-ACP synthase III [Flavobacteriales bacterium]